MWRDNPTEMEEARQRAVQASRSAYQGRNKRIAEFVREWLPEMTNTQLKERVLLRASEMGYKPRSFKTKVKRLGLIAYDPQRKLWVNRSK